MCGNISHCTRNYWTVFQSRCIFNLLLYNDQDEQEMNVRWNQKHRHHWTQDTERKKYALQEHEDEQHGALHPTKKKNNKKTKQTRENHEVNIPTFKKSLKIPKE